MTKTFNWHDADRDSFLHWLIPTLMVGNDSLMESLSEATDKWQSTELDIRINGVSVNVDHFIESIQMNMRSFANDCAHKMLRDSANLSEVMDAAYAAQQTIKQAIREAVHNSGLGIDTYEGWLDENH